MKYRFEVYCKNYQDIENYEAAKKDNFVGWEVHHRLETHNSDGERRLVDITRDELLALGMYYNRPADELIFLTISEHSRLHMKGKRRSEETRKKISSAQKGRPAWNKGKKMSEEFCRKNSESHKGEKNSFYGRHHTEESKRMNSEAHKGKYLGKDNPFYGKHHSDELKKKLSEINKVKMKGMRFFNNGKINIRAKECPEGFVPGRIKKP